MPQINRYEVEATIRFEVEGPISHAGAVKAAEERAAKALAGSRRYDDPVKAARITSVTADDTTMRPRTAGGGHR